MSLSERRLVVYHTADIHSRLGFGAKLAAMVEPDALLVDCGDSLRGSSTLYRSREPVIGEMRLAPYRAQAVGNREFHYVHRFFARRASLLPAPLVCSNLIDLRVGAAPFVRELRLTIAHVRVRLLALLVPQYRTGSGWEKVFGWRFLAPAAALHELLAGPNAADSSADVTIVLSHLGLAADRVIASGWPQCAAILGGHSHDLLLQPEIVNGVPIVHSGAYARYVGRLTITLAPGVAPSFCYRALPLLAPQP